MSKNERYNKLIHAKEWKTLRRLKLTRAPLCERCRERGIVRAAVEVHHITPVESALFADEMRSLMYDYNNLMSLCHSCHVEEHTRRGRSGRAHNRKRSEELLRSFKNKFIK